MTSQAALKLVAKEEGDKQRALEAALAQIDRAFGKGSVMKLGEKGKVEMESVSTGSLGLDIALGIGGLPKWPGAVIAAEGNDGMVKTLAETPGGLAYVSYDRVIKHHLSAAQLPAGGGGFIAASEPAFRAAVSSDPEDHFA